MRYASVILLAGLSLGVPLPSGAADLITGRASILDGDTLEIRGQRIRLHGIDAPEKGQRCHDNAGKEYRCGQKAANTLDYRVSGATVFCEPLDTDRYGRIIARCLAHAEDLSAWMAGLGWAVAYRKYSMDYVPAEELAQQRKAGMWSGAFVMPWDWRKGAR